MSPSPSEALISVVVPVVNEQRNSLFPRLLDSLKRADLEVVFVDGGSRDGTCERIESEGFRVIRTNESQRARRLNIGVAATKGSLVVLHHPRSVLEAQAFEQLRTLPYPSWGAFTHCFDHPHPLLRFTSWYSNHVRFRRGIVYLDHCMVVAREWLDAVGGVPEIDIFEDTELSLRLISFAAPKRLKAASLTSAIRFVSKGIIQQSLSNQWLKLKYYGGTDRSQLNQRYEGTLELNGSTAETKKVNHMKADFQNTEIAFRHLNNARLWESYLVFKALGVTPLVKFSTTLIAKGLEMGLPITPLVRHTIFRQFCGGVDAKSCMKLVKHMAKFGVGAILDYSVEALDREEDYDDVVKETLRCIKLAKANPEILPMCVFKVTAIARFSLLEKLSAHERLSSEEQAEYERILARVRTLAEAAADAHIALLVDAEESWVQKALDDLALLMMKEFNRERCVVYNTLQMYRHDRLSYLEEMIALAKTEGFLFGAKFVRGAYMEKERARAKSLGMTSPINKDKLSTDQMFDDGVAMALGEIEYVGVFIGTHNDASTAKAIALMAKLNISPKDPRVLFSQLYGMSDHLSYNLAHAGYRVAKYLPYGPVKSVLPYLFRRAEENSSIKGQAGRELKLIRAEIKRRRNGC